MRCSGLDGFAVLDHRLDGECHVCAGEAFVFGFFAGDDGDGEVVAEEFLVLAVDHACLDDGLVLGFVGGVAFLPEKLSGAEEKAGPHFPAHDVGPLVDEEWEVAVRLDPACEGGADDGFRGGADDVGLGELPAGDHFRLSGDGVLDGFKAVMGDDGALRGKAFRVLGFFFQVGKRDEKRKIGVLVACGFEAAVELLLDEFPNAVAPGLDDHAAARFRIFGEVGGFDDLLVPLGEISGAGRGDGGLFGGHGCWRNRNHATPERASKNCGGAGDSAEEEQGELAVPDERGGGAAEEEVANARVTEGSHDEQVNFTDRGLGGDDFVGVAVEDLRGDLVAGVAEGLRGGFQLKGEIAVGLADGEEVAFEASEEGLGDGVVDGFERAWTAVEGDEKPLDRAEFTCGDQDGDLRAADHAFEIAAEVAGGEIRMFATFSEDDE